MRTTMPDTTKITHKWYIIDAAGKPLGRTATVVAHLLRGKHKVDFTPNMDMGDHVIVINAEKAILTGKKLEQKYYYRHSGHPGGLKEIRYDRMMAEQPEKAFLLAVRRMLPGNSLGRKALTRCRVYRGAEHQNEAQQPEVWAF